MRKIKPVLITKKEKAVVEKALKKYTHLQRLKIDIDEEVITMYIAEQDSVGKTRALWEKDRMHVAGITLDTTSPQYNPIMQFILIEHDKRIFMTRRLFPLGRTSEWLQIGGAGGLEDLVCRYLQHINKDSYFDLS